MKYPGEDAKGPNVRPPLMVVTAEGVPLVGNTRKLLVAKGNEVMYGEGDDVLRSDVAAVVAA